MHHLDDEQPRERKKSSHIHIVWQQNNVTENINTDTDSEKYSKNTKDNNYEFDDNDDDVPLYWEKTITFGSKAKISFGSKYMIIVLFSEINKLLINMF